MMVEQTKITHHLGSQLEGLDYSFRRLVQNLFLPRRKKKDICSMIPKIEQLLSRVQKPLLKLIMNAGLFKRIWAKEQHEI